jgi:hypothetical protein
MQGLKSNFNFWEGPIHITCFSKDENEDHPNKKLWLLGISSAKYKPTLKWNFQQKTENQ